MCDDNSRVGGVSSDPTGGSAAAPVVQNQTLDVCCGILFQILNKETRSAAAYLIHGIRFAFVFLYYAKHATFYFVQTPDGKRC